MYARLVHRVRRSITTRPGLRGWGLTAAVGVAALALELAIGLAGGFLRPAPGDWSMLPWSLLLAVFVPSIGEELVFRGLLTPSREEQPSLAWAILPPTVLFVLWHVFEALTFMPGAAAVFLRPDFLATTAVLGISCGYLRHRTGSLWPAVVLHWAEVAGWQIWFGGGEIAKTLT